MKSATYALCVVGLVLVACADKQPAKVSFSNIPEYVTHADATSLGATVYNKAGEVLPGVPLTFSGVPANVVEISAAGDLKCLDSGDVIVTATGAGVSATQTIRCRLVEEIRAPRQVRAIIGNEPVKLGLAVLGKGEKPLADVPVDFARFDSAIARVEGGAVVPVGVGRTKIEAKAGTRTSVTEVEVQKKVRSEPLSIADGQALLITLQQGDYLVEAKANAGPRHGIAISWVGAACPMQKEAPSHSVRCRVDNTATLRIDNPSVFGMGEPAAGFLDIYEVPGK